MSTIVRINDLGIDEFKPFDEKKEDLKKLMEAVFPEYKEITFEILKGGLTNKLYLATVKGDLETFRIVIRTNGVGSDRIISRKKELEIFEKYSGHGGSQLYGIFRNGIIYEYLEGRPLSNTEMRDRKHQVGIAPAIARMHKLKIILDDSSVSIIRYLEQWFQELKKIDVKDETLKKRLSVLNLDKIRKEIQLIKKITKKWDNRVVFAHNDLLGGNIIWNEERNTYRFIDYEYGGMNYRGFDLGNHICEYMGFDCDNWRPSKDLIMNLLRLYLLETKKIGESDSNVTVSETELNELYEEVMVGTLMSNLMWGVWALFRSFFAEGFDYFTYGESKIGIYFQERDRIFKELNIDV